MKNIPEEIREEASGSNMSDIFSRESVFNYDRLNVDLL
jgi:hypothetical protein